MPYRIVQIGLGPLGLKIYTMAQAKKSFVVVGAIDKNKELKDKDIGRLAGKRSANVKVESTIKAGLKGIQADVAVLTTVSDMETITPMIEEIVSHGLHVVSTCEELMYAWDESPHLAQRIDRAAKEAGVAVLGTGVNPGFLMDALPTFFTGLSAKVDKIEVFRVQDAQIRRKPFLDKIGAGLTTEEFNEKKAEGSLRHIGLTESMQFIANQLGWKLDLTEDSISAVVASKRIQTSAISIKAGRVAGIKQIGRAFIGSKEKIRLVFQAAVGESKPYDEIRLFGDPQIVSRIDGGINGDTATCAVTLNAIPSVMHALPGLRSMADVPMITCHM
jgi:4-hydroxy-tetrahydrodipicolinate reductase